MRVINPRLKFLQFTRSQSELHSEHKLKGIILEKGILKIAMKLKIMKMNKRFLAFLFLVAILLFIYFGSYAMMDIGMNERVVENDWIGRGYAWIPASVSFCLCVIVGWLFFKKEHHIPGNRHNVFRWK